MNTRKKIIRLLRRSDHTVSQLASELDVTSNAVRSHLSILERDGLVRPVGLARETPGRPARLYGLTPKAEEELSAAYSTVLDGVLDVLSELAGPDLTRSVMRETGKHLARQASSGNGSLHSRVELVGEVLGGLGGLADIEETESGYRIRGYGCPFSVLLPEHPEICTLAEELAATITGASVRESCDRGEEGRRASCEFYIDRQESSGGGQASPPRSLV